MIVGPLEAVVVKPRAIWPYTVTCAHANDRVVERKRSESSMATGVEEGEAAVQPVELSCRPK